MEAFNLPQSNKENLQGLDKVNQDKDLEFRVDDLWYKIGAEQPFSGLSLSYHENGKVRSQTKVKEGKAYGLIEEWDENGSRLGTQFKNEFISSE
jgi:hypothetical protein